jgi:hypothetical protein
MLAHANVDAFKDILKDQRFFKQTWDSNIPLSLLVIRRPGLQPTFSSINHRKMGAIEFCNKKLFLKLISQAQSWRTRHENAKIRNAEKGMP